MVKEIIISAVAAVLVTLAVIALKRVVEITKACLQEKLAKAERENSETLKVMYSLAITVLDNLANITVSRIEATKAATIRKAVKAGKKGFTELTQLSEEAYQDIVEQISPSIMQVLESCVGDTERLIRNKIEEVLPRIKQEYASITSDTGVEELETITEEYQEDGEKAKG